MRNVLLLLLTCLPFWAQAQKSTNFVFILVDDLGWTDLGYTGSTFYKTPHIDALSQKSIQFTNAYAASSICSPSRAAIMTGKHPVRLEITDWIPGQDPKNQPLLGPQDKNELSLNERTLAEQLAGNGYHTFFAGKWHLGSEGFYPEQQGFEVNIGGFHKGSPPGGYYTPYKNPKLSDGPKGEYLTDRLTNESIHFLDTIGQKPFFLFLSFYTVHTPIQANLHYVDDFKRKLEKLETPIDTIKVEGNGLTNLVQDNAAYASMVYALDQNVGRLIEQLKKKGLYESTTIIFTSDNGGLSTLSKHRKRKAPTSVLPLRAGKGWLYEGGIRVPLLMKPAYYTGKARLCYEPVIGQDFYPTIVSMAGIAATNDQLDGIDLSPLIQGNGKLERKALFWHYPHYHGSGWVPGAAIRMGDWKLIEFHESNSIEVYNLADDLSETNNLVDRHPEKTEVLLTTLRNLQTKMKAQFAQPNPNYNAKNKN